MCFGGASIPAPPLPAAVAPAPTQADPAVAAAAQQQAMRAALASRNGTVLTSSQGDLSPVNLAKKTVLGS